VSANRRTTGAEPGLDCPEEITFEEFLSRCSLDPICRVQGHNPPPTGKIRRLVRFNRAVRVLVHTAVGHGRWPKVEAVRVQWNRLLGEYVDTGETMTIMWRDLDWVTPQASNDPNGTWIKVKEVR
jgi:hypothetical protein